MPGRKSAIEELEIVKRYSELSPLFFKFLKEMLESKDKGDKKWATEQLGKAYTRMIPQTLQGGESDRPLIIQIAGEVKDKYDAKTNNTTSGNSEGQTQI